MKKDFHTERCEEVEEQGILDVVLALSKEFLARGEDAVLARRDLEHVLAKATEGTGATPLAARKQLAHLGFIWPTPDGDWEPGIPSLCAHFVEQSER